MKAVKENVKSYTNFENDLYEALELFHVNAGPMYDDSNMDNLKKEIRDQVLTEHERADIEKRVCNRRQIGHLPEGHIYTCASCGIRDPYDMKCN